MLHEGCVEQRQFERAKTSSASTKFGVARRVKMDRPSPSCRSSSRFPLRGGRYHCSPRPSGPGLRSEVIGGQSRVPIRSSAHSPRSLVSTIGPAPPTRLLLELNLVDDDPPIDRLAHVVDRQGEPRRRRGGPPSRPPSDPVTRHREPRSLTVDFVGGLRKSTVRHQIHSGWQSGIKSPVRLAAMIPATRADPGGASPLATLISRSWVAGSRGAIRTRPLAPGPGGTIGDLLRRNIHHLTRTLVVKMRQLAHLPIVPGFNSF